MSWGNSALTRSLLKILNLTTCVKLRSFLPLVFKYTLCIFFFFSVRFLQRLYWQTGWCSIGPLDSVHSSSFFFYSLDSVISVFLFSSLFIVLVAQICVWGSVVYFLFQLFYFLAFLFWLLFMIYVFNDILILFRQYILVFTLFL